MLYAKVLLAIGVVSNLQAAIFVVGESAVSDCSSGVGTLNPRAVAVQDAILNCLSACGRYPDAAIVCDQAVANVGAVRGYEPLIET